MTNESYVVGVDGGGTKTVCALADLRGKIAKKAVIGPSNPNKVGEEVAIKRLGEGLKKSLAATPLSAVKFVYIALAGSLERDLQKRQDVKRLLIKKFPEFGCLENKIKVEGDQRAAFRSGTDEQNGVLLIAGTGSIAMGWRSGKEAVSGGWDYILGDQGSAFWIGQEVLRIVCKELDGRSSANSLLAKHILRKWGVQKDKELVAKVYCPDFVEEIASLAALVDIAAKKGDKLACKILEEAGDELVVMANTVIKQLGFQKTRFPMVLIGGVFKSKFVLERTKDAVFEYAAGADFILPRAEPVVGAVKIALDEARH